MIVKIEPLFCLRVLAVFALVSVAFGTDPLQTTDRQPGTNNNVKANVSDTPSNTAGQWLDSMIRVELQNRKNSGLTPEQFLQQGVVDDELVPTATLQFRVSTTVESLRQSFQGSPSNFKAQMLADLFPQVHGQAKSLPVRNVAVIVPDFEPLELSILQRRRNGTMDARELRMKLRNGNFEPSVVHVIPNLDKLIIDVACVDAPLPPETQRLQKNLPYNGLLRAPETLYSSLVVRGASFAWDSPHRGEVFRLSKPGVKLNRPLPVEFGDIAISKGWLVVHYYASVSGDDGKIRIDGLPANTRLKLRMFHPSMEYDFAGAKLDRWMIDRYGEVTVELKTGVNDFGTMDLDEPVGRALNRLLH